MRRVLVLVIALTTGCWLEHRCSEDDLLTWKGAEPVSTFRVIDERHVVLWQIERAASMPLEEVRYGTVPAGFTQTIPSRGTHPRAFVKGERISTETLTSRSYAIHEGVATGAKSFCGGFYQTGPIERRRTGP